jgi:hypothetical protein
MGYVFRFQFSEKCCAFHLECAQDVFLVFDFEKVGRDVQSPVGIALTWSARVSNSRQ